MSMIFSPQEPHHFSDYGFDPQITHFQIAEESRRHHCRARASLKPIDSIRFKLQKPISKDESRRTSTAAVTKSKSKTTKKKRWWKKAVSYIKAKWADNSGPKRTPVGQQHADNLLLSRPVYATVSRSASTSPNRNYHSTTPFGWMVGGDKIPFPYVSLRETNVGRISTSSTPLYLVI